ncbi:hypothetical protein ABWI01_11965 [Oceanicaulis alexandrii]|uniref:hypothetical protein n=1 Tax=Oceanicaulis alexandrii TaxID=153233 RepID=UPI0035D0CB9B
MMKLNKRMVLTTCLAAAVTLTGLAGAAYAFPWGTPERMYITEYFTDASMTTPAGVTIDRCVNGQVVAQPSGVTPTAYFRREWIGMCPGYLF